MYTKVFKVKPYATSGEGKERLPTPVFWSGEFHGLYSPWGHKELDMTEQLSLLFVKGLSDLFFFFLI